jgi:uncharacterized protein (TIGR00730 family)
MDKRTPSICVFCGSSFGSSPDFADAARRLGELIAKRGFSLVFGGGAVGLMGEVSRAVSLNGGSVTGVLPEFLKHLEPPSRATDKLIVTPDMQERKKHMLALSDAFVVLPGGLGTLDEIFEVLSTAQLKVHRKPIVLVNLHGHFDPVIKLIAHVVKDGFAASTANALYRVVKTPEQAIEAVEEQLTGAQSEAR